MPVTAPDAEIFTAAEPDWATLMPLSEPDTGPVVIEISPPAAPVLFAFTPSPPAAVTAALTFIEIAPSPRLSASIPLSEPLIHLPLADWVNLMPPVPVWPSANEVPPLSPSVKVGVSA